MRAARILQRFADMETTKLLIWTQQRASNRYHDKLYAGFLSILIMGATWEAETLEIGAARVHFIPSTVECELFPSQLWSRLFLLWHLGLLLFAQFPIPLWWSHQLTFYTKITNLSLSVVAINNFFKDPQCKICTSQFIVASEQLEIHNWDGKK